MTQKKKKKTKLFIKNRDLCQIQVQGLMDAQKQ